MDFLHISGYDVAPGKNIDFQKWVQANAAALSNLTPDGIELVGIYASMFDSEKKSGHYKSVWRMDSYGAMDRFAAEAGSNAELTRLLDEFASFQDVRLGSGESVQFLKSVSDVTIWGDFPEE